jgi:hypothetical protein
MRVYWALRGGESSEIYDGGEGASKDSAVVYRIGVERLVQCELKIIKQPGKHKIINNDSRMKIVDVATTGALYVEAVGNNGLAFGWYEAVLAL